VIYFQICVNFRNLGENEDEKGKLEHWKLAQNLPKKDHSIGTHPRLVQGSPKKVHSSEVGFFLVKLTQASNDSLRLDVT